VRVNDALYAPAREKLDDIVRTKGFPGSGRHFAAFSPPRGPR